MAKLKLFWLITTAAAFWGPYLAVSAFPQLFGYRILLLAHLIALAFVLVYKHNLTARLEQVKVRDQLRFFFFWLLWAVVSMLWADSKLDGARHIFALFSGIALISCTVFYMDTEKDLRDYSRLCLATLLVFMLIGLWENLTGFHLKPMSIIDPVIYAHEAFYPRVIFTNTNDFATFVALYLPFFYATAKYSSSWWTKAFASLAVLLGIYLIIITDSRANILALLLMIACALFLYLLQTKLKGVRNLLIIGLIICCAWWLAGSTGLRTLGIHNFIYQITSLNEETQEKGSSIELRMGLLRGGFEILKKHAFMGVGAGNAEYHMQDYWLWTRGLTNLHNWWMEVLVNYGVIIWVLYICFYVRLMWNLFTVQRNSAEPLHKSMAEGVLLSMTGFLIGAFSSSTLYAANFMWFIFALGLAVYNRFLNTKSENSLGPDSAG